MIAPFIGNLPGYTVFTGGIRAEHVLWQLQPPPTYVTKWNGEAFLVTTVVPLILMTVVNVIVLGRKLTLSPHQFLRRDLEPEETKRAAPLSLGDPFFSRFTYAW